MKLKLLLVIGFSGLITINNIASSSAKALTQNAKDDYVKKMEDICNQQGFGQQFAKYNRTKFCHCFAQVSAEVMENPSFASDDAAIAISMMCIEAQNRGISTSSIIKSLQNGSNLNW